MRRQILAALGMLLVLALGLAACGGNGKSPAATKKDDQAKLRNYAKCMRANGIDMPDPTDGRVEMKVAGKDGQEKMQAAEKKCRHLMPNGGKPRKPDAAELARERALAKCMRANGINMPDPDPNGGGIHMQGGESNGEKHLSENDPKLAAARKACSKYEPKDG